MNLNERRIYNQLRGKSSSLELLEGGQVSRSEGINAQINQIVGNPAFKAEVSFVIQTRYYTDAVANTPGTPAAAGAPPAAQQGLLPLYLFGNIDKAANYARSRAMVPGGAGWTYAQTSIIEVGTGQLDIDALSGAVHPLAYPSGTIWFGFGQVGDLLFITPMALFVAAAVATSWRAETLIHCNNVPYLSLLEALNSDLVTLNMIRYVVPAAAVAQLAQQISFIKTSLFGKTAIDTLDPQTFITPGTFQPQIADIPITLPIDKNLIVATQILYTAVIPITFTWTLTVSGINKLQQ